VAFREKKGWAKMRIKKLWLTGLVGLTAMGVMPLQAQAAECVPNVPNTTVDDKVVGRTCWDCGWIMIRGQSYTLVNCD
jgi:hypothetical protein